VKKNEYHAKILYIVGIEQKQESRRRSVMVFGIPISSALTAAQRQNEEEKKEGDLFNSLNLRDN
jgi:hypothetical protein